MTFAFFALLVMALLVGYIIGILRNIAEDVRAIRRQGEASASEGPPARRQARRKEDDRLIGK